MILIFVWNFFFFFLIAHIIKHPTSQEKRKGRAKKHQQIQMPQRKSYRADPKPGRKKNPAAIRPATTENTREEPATNETN